MDVGYVFLVVEVVIFELFCVEDVESLVGSLQVCVYVCWVDFWNGCQFLCWNLLVWLVIKCNSVLVMVMLGQGISIVILLFEFDVGWWVDLLVLDEGSNFENVEVVIWVISCCVVDQCCDEQVVVEQMQVEKELLVVWLNLLYVQVELYFLYNMLVNVQVLICIDLVWVEQMFGYLI